MFYRQSAPAKVEIWLPQEAPRIEDGPVRIDLIVNQIGQDLVPECDFMASMGAADRFVDGYVGFMYQANIINPN